MRTKSLFKGDCTKTYRTKSSFQETQRQQEINIENNNLIQKITGIYCRHNDDVTYIIIFR